MLVDRLNSAARRVPAWMFYPFLAVPGLWLFWLAVQNRLGADPIAALEHGLGEYALQLLILGLAITPLRDLARVNLVKFRRAIGVMAFVYVLAHVAVYLLLDQQLYWDAIWKDVTKRPYIIVGVLSGLILLPLALSSNNMSVRRLGAAAWRRLHWWVYPAILLGAAHYVLLKKTWQAEPLIYFAVCFLLVAYRWRRVMPGVSRG